MQRRLSSSRRELAEDTGEQAGEHVALGGRQGVQDNLLNPCECRVQGFEPSSPGGGQSDQVSAPVGGVGGARDVALFYQLIEHRVHVTLVDSASVGDLHLAVRSELVQR